MMVVFRQLLVWVLYAVILIKPLLTSKIDGDYIVYNETTSFVTTLRILDEIRCKSCLPCFTQTANWKGPDMFNKQDLSPWPTKSTLQSTVVNTDSVTEKTRKNKQGNLSPWPTKSTLQSTVVNTDSVTEKTRKNKQKNLSSRSTKNTLQSTVANTDSVIGKTKKNKQKKTSTTVMKELQLKTSTSNNEKTDQEGSGDNDYKDDVDNDIDHENTDRKYRKKCNHWRRCCKIEKYCPTSVDAGKQKDCPACVDVGILFITHVIAAVIGAGILYVIQIIKKYRRKRNDEPNRKSNEGMVNVAYGLTRGAEVLQTSNVNHQEEAIYNEVDDKPSTVLIDHTSSNCSAGSRSNNRKHSKLPDIPNENERDEENLPPQTPKDPLLSDVSDKVKTAIYLVPEEQSLKDLNESNQRTEHDANLKNCGQETIVTDSGDDYFVLKKTDNMDLK